MRFSRVRWRDTLLSEDAVGLGPHEGFFAVLEERLGADRLRQDRGALDVRMKEQETLLQPLRSWLHVAALADIDEPGIRARAELRKRSGLDAI